jgi:hypothetical protein
MPKPDERSAMAARSPEGDSWDPHDGARRSLRPSSSVALVVAGLLVMTLIAVSCSSAAPSAGTSPPKASTSTVWLCRPAQPHDPCAPDLITTEVSASGKSKVIRPSVASTASKFDCFYVYPTVSVEKSVNSNLEVQSAETEIATQQAAQFSKVCRVWAPMYRQFTVSGLAHLSGTAISTAYASIEAAFDDYLAHDNDGRPIIFIGHSQGAAMLIRLLRSVIDPSPALRHRMVSAIILGGNVQVPVGRPVGGSFAHIPTCASAHQVGCVIAYSTFGSPPPSTSNFGRPGQGVSLQSGQTTKAGQQVACVNPVNFGAGPGALLPYFPTSTSRTPGVRVTTPWVTYPGLYKAQCMSGGGATWLQITAQHSPGDPRPTVSAVLGPDWGLHLDDVNLALGDLVHDVSLEEAAYR